MKFVSEPAIALKIDKMKQRVRWQEAALIERGIDQTRFVFDTEWADQPEFSFLVVGDSGSGLHAGHTPQRRIAEQMLPHLDQCRFMLHTGDVIYLVGSSEFYPKNFIEPYREWLVGGDQPQQIAYDRMVFQVPILPVLGNHDYYDLPLLFGFLAQGTLPLRRLFQLKLELDIGWHGSHQGKAFAQAFMDYLKDWDAPRALGDHLDRHYIAQTSTGRCLQYKPGHFTRLPNRYYTFRCGGIDFFALDSNTFNEPAPLPDTPEGVAYRQLLEQRQKNLDNKKNRLLETAARLNMNDPEEADHLEEIRTRIEQLDEIKLDIDKQLTSDQTTPIDWEQLEWLQQRLIESWHTPEVRGRIIYFHHPPYVTEATKWEQGQTFAVRRHLRWVLDAVAAAVADRPANRPLVDLILSGHAHCLEVLRTSDTGHADSHLNWMVCGGSGFSLRRQRPEGPELEEWIGDPKHERSSVVGRSLLFVGRSGYGSQKRRPYSFVRIDVQAGTPPQFVLRPFITEKFQGKWRNYALEPLVL